MFARTQPIHDDTWNKAWKIVSDVVDDTPEGEKVSVSQIVDALDSARLIRREGR